MTTFNELNLHQGLLQSLNHIGFETATEIQAQFIPMAMEGGDVMASAQTGSGKTAAFLLPAFQKILENPDESKAQRKKRGPRVLVLTPTRELAEQVMQVAGDLRSYTDLSVKSVVGGVPIMKHKRMLREVVDVLIATPGRLIDLMKQGDVHLKDVETFVLDEADRMLDMGFSEDVLKISKATKLDRQTLLVSATLEGKGLDKIIKQVMVEPKKVELTHAKQRHENITQTYHRASDGMHKTEIVKRLAEDQKIWQAVIFTATKAMTEKLAQTLAGKGEKVDVLHGDMRQSARKVSMKRMQAGHIRFLVATDVAARGLDIKDLTHVINFDLPRQSEDYIHRIGRVGRGGKTGEAISLVSNEQWGALKDIEHMLGQSIDEIKLEGLEWTPSKDKKAKKDKRNAKKSFDQKKRVQQPRQERSFRSKDAKRGFSDEARFENSRNENSRGERSEGFKKSGKPSGKRFGSKSFGSKSNGKSFGSKGSDSRSSGGRSSESRFSGEKSFGPKSKVREKKFNGENPAAPKRSSKKKSFGSKKNFGGGKPSGSRIQKSTGFLKRNSA